MDRKLYMRKLEHKIKAATTIQRHYRGYRQRQIYNYILIDKMLKVYLLESYNSFYRNKRGNLKNNSFKI